jgi:hypothetical protein
MLCSSCAGKLARTVFRGPRLREERRRSCAIIRPTRPNASRTRLSTPNRAANCVVSSPPFTPTSRPQHAHASHARYGPARTASRLGQYSRATARNRRPTAARSLGKRLHQACQQPILGRRSSRTDQPSGAAPQDGRRHRRVSARGLRRQTQFRLSRRYGKALPTTRADKCRAIRSSPPRPA